MQGRLTIVKLQSFEFYELLVKWLDGTRITSKQTESVCGENLVCRIYSSNISRKRGHRQVKCLGAYVVI